jgi:hypothetical protein
LKRVPNGNHRHDDRHDDGDADGQLPHPTHSPASSRRHILPLPTFSKRYSSQLLLEKIDIGIANRGPSLGWGSLEAIHMPIFNLRGQIV